MKIIPIEVLERTHRSNSGDVLQSADSMLV